MLRISKMTKKNLALVMGTSPTHPFAVGNVLIGLRKNSPKFYDLIDDIIIYTVGDISETDKKAIKDIAPKVIFKNFDFDIQSNNPRVKRFTTVVFSKYKVFSLLKEYVHTVWLDADIMIMDDISELLNYGPIGMRKPGGSKFIYKALGYTPDDLDKSVRTRSTSVIHVSDELENYEKIAQECESLTKEKIDVLNLADQAVISYILYRNKVKISTIPLYLCHHIDYTSVPIPKLIHQSTDYKMWNNGIIAALSPQWYSNNDVWIKKGGTPYLGLKTDFEISRAFNTFRGSLFLGKIYKEYLKKLQEQFLLQFDNYLLKEIAINEFLLTSFNLVDSINIKIDGYELVCSYVKKINEELFEKQNNYLLLEDKLTSYVHVIKLKKQKNNLIFTIRFEIDNIPNNLLIIRYVKQFMQYIDCNFKN